MQGAALRTRYERDRTQTAKEKKKKEQLVELDRIKGFGEKGKKDQPREERTGESERLC